jgi:hypothetical protein
MVAFSKGSSVLASISFMTSGICKISRGLKRRYTDKKENEIFSSFIRKFRWERWQSHICMRKGFLLYEAVSHILVCNCSILDFLIYEENSVLLEDQY